MAAKKKATKKKAAPKKKAAKKTTKKRAQFSLFSLTKVHPQRGGFLFPEKHFYANIYG